MNKSSKSKKRPRGKTVHELFEAESLFRETGDFRLVVLTMGRYYKEAPQWAWDACIENFQTWEERPNTILNSKKWLNDWPPSKEAHYDKLLDKMAYYLMYGYKKEPVYEPLLEGKALENYIESPQLRNTNLELDSEPVDKLKEAAVFVIKESKEENPERITRNSRTLVDRWNREAEAYNITSENTPPEYIYNDHPRMQKLFMNFIMKSSFGKTMLGRKIISPTNDSPAHELTARE